MKDIYKHIYGMIDNDNSINDEKNIILKIHINDYIVNFLLKINHK